MSTTHENLMSAFAGESQANRKYLAFAAAADKEGLHQVAKLFRAAAAAETVHAHAHLKNAGKIGDTVANLKAAIEGETYEFTEMYPPMVELAVADGHKAKTMFQFADDAEAVHATIYTKALEAVKKGVDLDVSEFYLCPVCGYIELGKAPEKCPVCGAKQAIFEQVA